MTYNTWDDLITELLIEAEKQEIQQINDNEPSTIPLHLHNKLRQLIGMKKVNNKKILHILSRAAIIFLVIFTALSTAYVLSPKARAFVDKMIQTVYKDHNTYHFSTKPTTIEKGDYQLGYIPEGFELVEELDWDNDFILTYSNENKERIVFNYRSASLGNSAIDNEQMTHTKITVNGMDGVIAYSKKENFVIAFILDNDVLIKIMGDFDDYTAIKILENIQKNK